MSKNKNERNSNRREFKIPDDAKKFAKTSLKKFKKENKGYYDSKKEMKKGYYAEITDLLPSAISLVVKFGHLDEVKETKLAIYDKLTDSGYIKYLKKEIKNDCDFDGISLLPNVIYDIISEAKKQTEIENAENPDQEVEYDLDDLIEISKLILKKKIKKMKKSGIPEDVAFDVLSVIPTSKILTKSQYYHIRQFFGVIYEHAKTKEINFGKIMDIMFKDDVYVNSVITFALLERKEKISNFTDSQKKLFNDITDFCFSTMEEMKRDDITAILKAYANARKRDESSGKDTNRRYYISSLPEKDYPRILKSVSKITDLDESLKKYF